MITLEAHPEIHVEEQRQRPAYSTCYECHRTFRAKSEDQLCLELCDSCFEDLRSLREPIVSVHVKPRARGSAITKEPTARRQHEGKKEKTHTQKPRMGH